MRRLLVAVVAGALLVLLVACANVATLFIGRDVAREREFAARMALGATRRRLVRGLFVETSLIALIASLCGLAVGAAALRLFLALGVRFLAGRDFGDEDARPEAASVILSRSAARFYFPGEDPIGRTISRLPAMFGIAGDPRVIGVVSDIKYEGLDSPAGSALYLPWSRRPLGRGYLIVRAAGDPMRLAADIRRAGQLLDPMVPMPELQSLEDAMAQSIANRRVRALPAVGFGLLALALAFIGVLATVSTFVAERRRDLAIRSALGASPAQLVWSVVAQGLILTAVGLVIGVGLGAAAARAISSLLYGVGPYDVTTFAGTALLIGAGAASTAYIAAARARSVDPLVALKYE